MFTGLVTNVGTLDRTADTPAGRELRVTCGYDDLVQGESVAVNGACLTVRECAPGWFTAAAVTTTVERTAIGSWATGRRVNLERALRAGDRLGGHFVLGHVDAVGEVTEIRATADARLITIAVAASLHALLVPHGSLAVDGVSLTVNAIGEPSSVQVSLVEYTMRNTTLGDLAVGDAVHVEGDVIGKYVQRMAAGLLAGVGNQP